jgi:hypothetical protein
MTAVNNSGGTSRIIGTPNTSLTERLRHSHSPTRPVVAIQIESISPCCMNTIGRYPPNRRVWLKACWKYPYTQWCNCGLSMISIQHSGTYSSPPIRNPIASSRTASRSAK